MCCVKLQTPYEEMIHESFEKGVPYIIWPQAVINIIVHEIKLKRTSKLIVEFDNGKMKYRLEGYE